MRRGALLFVGACAALAVACAVGGQIATEDSGTPGGDGGNGSDVVKIPTDGAGPDGSTTTCTSPQFLCGDAGCVDLTSNANHCGQCNTTCTTADAGGLVPGDNGNPDAGVPAPDGGFPDAGDPWSLGTPTCAKSACGVTCPTTQTLCTDGVCYDTQQFHDHCGDCNTACQTTEYCAKGHCCASGTEWCGSACASVLTDTANCGSCGNACPNGQSCVNGGCTACSNSNVALLATATSSGGGVTTYGPADMNDGKGESQLCTSFEWTTASNTPGTAWIQYTWSSAHKITSMHMDTQSATVTDSCGNLGRTLGAATVQWWNGTAWVTDGTVSGKLDDWDYTFTSPVTTTQVRLYAIYCTNTQGQTSNPIVYEWQVTGCN